MSELLTRSPLPNRHSVRNTIQDLIGRDVDLSDGLPPPARTTNVVAVYVTDKLATSALAVIDLECAARLGGSLGMVPKAVVEEAIAARELPAPLDDNCYEVLNVLAAVFNVPNAPHVRLYKMYGPNSTLPGDIAALGALAGSRMDVELMIAGYGLGMLSIVVR
jgi:hypothetical protein